MFHAWPQKQYATNAGRQLAMFMVIAKRLSLNIFQFLTNEFLFMSNGLDLYAPTVTTILQLHFDRSGLAVTVSKPFHMKTTA